MAESNAGTIGEDSSPFSDVNQEMPKAKLLIQVKPKTDFCPMERHNAIIESPDIKGLESSPLVRIESLKFRSNTPDLDKSGFVSCSKTDNSSVSEHSLEEVKQPEAIAETQTKARTTTATFGGQ